MKIKSILLSLLLSTSSVAFADDNDTPAAPAQSYNFEFSGDINYQTAFTGADWTMSVIEGYRVLDDKIAPGPDSPLMNALMVIPRLLVAEYTSTFQHEVFGHGARVRDSGSGWKVHSYKFDWNGSASTTFAYNHNTPLQNLIAVNVAGMQATEVLSNKIKHRVVDSGSINPVYGAAYIMSAGDQLNYLLLTTYKGAGHDVKSYITNMNKIYGQNYMTRSKVRSNAALGLLDPFLYFSAYALATGQDFEYPMIPLGDWKYLPGFRGVMTPYGLENKMINYFRTPSTPFQFNISQGKNKRGTSWSAELIVDRIFDAGNADFGFNFATWNQPKMLTANVLTAPKKQGYSAEANIKLNLNETTAIYTAAGYKSAGFRLGYPLKAGALVRIGVSLKL